MSFDLMVYTQDLTRFSIEDCGSYLRAIGFCGSFAPEFEVLNFAGFLPFVFTTELMGDGILYRNGFEYYIDEYVSEPSSAISSRKPTLWERLTKKNVPVPVHVKDPFEGANYSIMLSCSATDSLSVLLALGFAAYTVSVCGGMIYDPQSDKIFDSVTAIGRQISVCMEDVKREIERGQLNLYREIQ